MHEVPLRYCWTVPVALMLGVMDQVVPFQVSISVLEPG